MKTLTQYRDATLAREILTRVMAKARQAAEHLGRPVTFMEVCGTHTVAISRLGLRKLLEGLVQLRSGPGCPVCVTDGGDIDSMLSLAADRDVTVLTFGDMLRVPGGRGNTLEKARAKGARVKIVYSPWQAVEMAGADPGGQYVMLGVGFETTAPAVALSIAQAQKKKLDNYRVYSAHKVVPPVLHALLGDPEVKLDGLLLPGHVAAYTGRRALEFVSGEYGIPAAVAGFDAVDVLGAIYNLLEQVLAGESKTVNCYARVVREEGNIIAQQHLERMFEVQAACWRGFGPINLSGLKLRAAWAHYDAALHFDLPLAESKNNSPCRCGDLLRGKILPHQCPLFGRQCRPVNPVGPCMVSSEGACAAFLSISG